MKAADYRVETAEVLEGTGRRRRIRAGPDNNIEWLHAHVPDVWRNMPNPYPASDELRLRGKKIYQQFCIGCHGPVGDGEGPAAAYLTRRR